MLSDFVMTVRTNHQARKWEHQIQLVQAYYRLTDRRAAEELIRPGILTWTPIPRHCRS